MAPMAVEPTSVAELGPASGPHVSLESPVQTKTSDVVERSNPQHEEYQYIDLIRDILDNGEHRPDRTGTGTYSLFAPRALRFTLSKPSSTPNAPPDLILPLLTTKRVFLRAVTAELLWFISGSTSSLPLSAAGIHIWDGNGSRAFLDSVGLSHREEGDLGPVYGFQWRHFGATYVDAGADYSGQGVDQLAEVVRKLKETPWDRRIVLSAWNPAAMKEMALPPCHMFAQFYVSYPSRCRRRGTGTASTNGANNGSATTGTGGWTTTATKDKEESGAVRPETAPAPEPSPEKETAKEQGILHTHLYQRSCDMGLGIPFNIASYALLTHMLAYVCDLVPGTLTHSMGDAHVYIDHVEALEEQIRREPREFPGLEIRDEGTSEGEERGFTMPRKGAGRVEALEGWKVEDFIVKGYKPHGKVNMKMSV